MSPFLDAYFLYVQVIQDENVHFQPPLQLYLVICFKCRGKVAMRMSLPTKEIDSH